MINRLLLGLFTVLLLGLGAQPAVACSCAAYPDDPEAAVAIAYAQADVIFVGKVSSIRKKRGRSPHIEAEFEVQTSWKESVDGRVLVRTNIGEIGCGYNFRKQRSYLVFAHWDHQLQHLNTSICDLTRPATRANRLITNLNNSRQHRQANDRLR